MVLLLDGNEGHISRFTQVLLAIDADLKLKNHHDASVLISSLKDELPRATLISLGRGAHPEDGLDAVSFLVSQPITCPVIIHSSEPGLSTLMATEFDKAGWSYSLVSTSRADWIETTWRRAVVNSLGQPRSKPIESESRADPQSQWLRWALRLTLIVLILFAGIAAIFFAIRTQPHSFAEMDPARIPQSLRFADQPAELLAVFPAPPSLPDYLTSEAMTLAFSPDGNRLAVGYVGGYLVVWNSFTLKEFASLQTHQKPIIRLRFFPDGQSLVDASWDGTAKICDLSNRVLRERATLGNLKDDLWGLAVSHAGHTVAISSADKTLSLWSVSQCEAIEQKVMRTSGVVHALCFSPDGSRLACGEEKAIILRNQGGEELFASPDQGGWIWDIAFSSSGTWLAVAGQDRMVSLWNTTSPQPVLRHRMSGHANGESLKLAFSEDEKWLVTADYAGRVILWDVARGGEHKRWQLPKGLRGIAFAPDSRHFATCGAGGRVYLMRIPDE